ncbi:RTX toxin [Rhizobium arsenicireducens]
MPVINSFYRNPSASAYATQLFSPADADLRPRLPSSSWGQSEPAVVAETSGQRALARIIEILALRDEAVDETGTVDETLGHITAARGGSGDDSLTFRAQSVSNVETGNGDDHVTAKAASIASIATGNGSDRISASGGFIAYVDAGGGDDVVEIAARLVMGISGGAGNDRIAAAGEALIGIDGGEGDDDLTLEGTRIFASGGTGNDTIVFKRTNQTASNAVAEYAFARGDGQDAITSNGGVTLRLDGYLERDVRISVTGNTLTASFEGTTDRITLTLDQKALNGAGLSYSFALDQGQTVLKVG